MHPQLIEAIQLAASSGMHTAEELCSIAHLAMQLQSARGEIVEFGTAQGYNAALMAMALPGRAVHLFDSFEGLPAPTAEDQDPPFHKQGMISVPEEIPLRTFEHFSLPPPILHKGWIEDQPALEYKVALAMIDCDYFSGCKASLNLLLPALSPGGQILVHDYGDENSALPGIKKAVDQFLVDHPNFGLWPIYDSTGRVLIRILMR